MSGFVFADPTEVKLETAEDAELMGAERDFQQARELFKQGKTSKAVDLFSTSLEIRYAFDQFRAKLMQKYIRYLGNVLINLSRIYSSCSVINIILGFSEPSILAKKMSLWLTTTDCTARLCLT